MYLLYGRRAHAAGFIARLANTVDRLVNRLLALYNAYEGHRAARKLATLDDRMLNDIGLSRSDVDKALFAPIGEDPISDLIVARFNRINARKQPIWRKR